MATRDLFTPSVLLVNETLDEREIYARSLRASGYRAVAAEDAAAAYQIAVTHRPNVVVTDIRIAGSIGGFELTRRLRKDLRTSAVRIIVLTTVLRPQDANVALKAGADTFLEKPVAGSVLAAEVARLVSSSARSIAPINTSNRCPQCDRFLIYRARWPVLTPESARQANGRERLRYVEGWFCPNPACTFFHATRIDPAPRRCF